jgi:hypothetical protein
MFLLFNFNVKQLHNILIILKLRNWLDIEHFLVAFKKQELILLLNLLIHLSIKYNLVLLHLQILEANIILYMVH